MAAPLPQKKETFMRSHAQALIPHRNDFDELGERLVDFGRALQDPNTTIGELLHLAQVCGIKLKLRVVAESGGREADHG